MAAKKPVKKAVKKTAPKAAVPKAAAPADTVFVGKVSARERDEMQTLFERKNGLLELVQSLAQNGPGMLDNTAFYEKVVADLGRTTTRSRQWWEEKAKAYGWPSKPGWQWSIDFESCRITMTEKK
jgi:CXXX repeat modification system protein